MDNRINNRNRLVKNLYWGGGYSQPQLLLAGIIGSGSSLSNPSGYGASMEIPSTLAAPLIPQTSPEIGLSLGLGIASGAMNILGDAVGNSRIADTTSLENGINNLKDFGIANSSTSKDELMSAWDEFNPIKNVSWKEVRGNNAGGAALSAGKSALSGASAGMALGPVGAGVGAVVGGLVSGIGSLFGRKKAKKKAARLNALINEANSQALRNLNVSANNINTTDTLTQLANVAAFGGPLGSMGGLALNYDLSSRALSNLEINNMSKLRMTSLPNYANKLDEFETEFADGGKIHIKNKNKGKFTKYCGGKVTSECINKGKNSNDPAVRKRATFALNAREWSHADGGNILLTYGMEGLYDTGGVLNTNGSTFTDDLTYINEGGTHELNPNDGVPIGVTPEGTPNLVEEGEVVYNDYVFSNRLKADGDLLVDFLLPKSLKGKTFADVAKYLNKGSKERPNDPISKRGLEANLERLKTALEGIRLKELISNSFAIGGKKRTNDPIREEEFLNWLHSSMNPLRNTLVNPIDIPEENVDPSVDRDSDALVSAYALLGQPTSRSSRLDLLRFTPALGAGVGVLGDLFGLNRPDYSNADMIMSLAKSIPNTEFNPVGDYLTYRPLDRQYYLNQLNANAAATRRSIENGANNRGAAMTGILAADYNTNNAVGNLARQSEEYNALLRERVSGFNRQTNMYNSEGRLKADMANRLADEMRLKAALSAALIRDLLNMRSSLIRSANLTNLFDSLGDIGRELFSMNMVNQNPALDYKIDLRGATKYKNKKAKGGKIKKGLTY